MRETHSTSFKLTVQTQCVPKRLRRSIRSGVADCFFRGELACQMLCRPHPGNQEAEDTKRKRIEYGLRIFQGGSMSKPSMLTKMFFTLWQTGKR